MEIEIITTKKKLTKSIISQFDRVTTDYMNNFISCYSESVISNVLFRVNNCIKGRDVIFFKGIDGEWKVYTKQLGRALAFDEYSKLARKIII